MGGDLKKEQLVWPNNQAYIPGLQGAATTRLRNNNSSNVNLPWCCHLCITFIVLHTGGKDDSTED